MGDLTKFKWYSFPRVIITNYTKETEGNIFTESVVRFTLEVRDGVNIWEVTKRYSEFEELHREIKSNYTNTIPIPEFPEKRNIFDRESYEAFITRRQMNLQNYINLLLRQAASLHSSAVRRFLAPPIRLSRPNCQDIFILPTLPAGFNMPILIKFKTESKEPSPNPSPRASSKSQEIPQDGPKSEKPKLFQSLFASIKNPNVNNEESDILIDFTLVKEDPENGANKIGSASPRNINIDQSKETFHVAVLFDSIKEKLELISKEKIKDEESSEQIVHNKENLMKLVEELERERHILQDLINKVQATGQAGNLTSYFEQVMEQTKKALEWCYSIITKFNGTIPFDIEQFERDGEKLVVDYVLARDRTNNNNDEVDLVIKKIRTNAKQLLQLIESSWRGIAKETSDQDGMAVRKDKLLSYVNSNIFPVQCE